MEEVVILARPLETKLVDNSCNLLSTQQRPAELHSLDMSKLLKTSRSVPADTTSAKRDLTSTDLHANVEYGETQTLCHAVEMVHLQKYDQLPVLSKGATIFLLLVHMSTFARRPWR